jgi:hypothetical protein
MEYIFAAAKFTLNFTGDRPRITAGGSAYIAPFVNILGTPEMALQNLEVSMQNVDRLNEHRPGGVVWSA